MAGVDVALQAAEHYYVITERVEGLDRDLPVIEDPDRYGYYRPEGDGILVGLFEPVAAPWQLDEIPRDFAFGELPPDLDRLTPYVETAMARIPALADVGIRQFFCGPESFTPDIRPMLGPAPEIDGFFMAVGLNSLGILLGGGVGTVIAQWIVDGVPPIDVAGYSVERVVSHEVSPEVPRRARRRATRRALWRCRLADLASEDRAQHPAQRAARAPRRGRCTLWRLCGLGVSRVVCTVGRAPQDHAQFRPAAVL
jgi:4-methylaminobutanoate oxidase (formaldehyde-forming)